MGERAEQRPITPTSPVHASDMQQLPMKQNVIDPKRDKFPFCVVWTPIPILTWLFPTIGHVGIGMSNGVIRDFAGPYFVSEDDMAFGRPMKYVNLLLGLIGTKCSFAGTEKKNGRYWKLAPENISSTSAGLDGWNKGVSEASEIYKHRMHNLCCDNCHSHVATALNIMQYDHKTSWNMFYIWLNLVLRSKYVSWCSLAIAWLPSLIIYGAIAALIILASPGPGY